jgi:hypothetical protein
VLKKFFVRRIQRERTPAKWALAITAYRCDFKAGIGSYIHIDLIKALTMLLQTLGYRFPFPSGSVSSFNMALLCIKREGKLRAKIGVKRLSNLSRSPSHSSIFFVIAFRLSPRKAEAASRAASFSDLKTVSNDMPICRVCENVSMIVRARSYTR